MSGVKGVKMPRGDKKQIMHYTLSIPSIKEQSKIALLLSLLDERIATQNKIIVHLESLIKGLTQELMRGKANVRLNDCLTCKTSTLQEGAISNNGDYPVYGASGLSGYDEDYQVSGDSILIVKDGSGVGTVSFATEKYSVIGTLNYLTTKDGYNIRYLYFCLSVFNFAPYKTGMAIPHIYFKDYGKAKVYCPSIQEQNRIAIALTAIQSKLQIEKDIKSYWENQKVYLLSNMFI